MVKLKENDARLFIAKATMGMLLCCEEHLEGDILRDINKETKKYSPHSYMAIASADTNKTCKLLKQLVGYNDDDGDKSKYSKKCTRLMLRLYQQIVLIPNETWVRVPTVFGCYSQFCIFIARVLSGRYDGYKQLVEYVNLVLYLFDAYVNKREIDQGVYDSMVLGDADTLFKLSHISAVVK